jgi:hypothetical protein
VVAVDEQETTPHDVPSFSAPSTIAATPHLGLARFTGRLLGLPLDIRAFARRLAEAMRLSGSLAGHEATCGCWDESGTSWYTSERMKLRPDNKVCRE